MSVLHFAGGTDSAQCQHVQARSREDLTGYFAYTLKRGDSHGYNLDSIRSGYAGWSGKSRNAVDEASQLLKNFELIGSDNQLTDWAGIIGTAYSAGRTNTVQELFKQHFRYFPTLAYSLDVLWQAESPIDHEEVYDRVMQYGASDSTIRANSIRNGLNLLEDFNAVANTENGWEIDRTDRPVIGSVAYGLLLMGRSQGVIDSEILRGRLPRLLNSKTNGTERVLHEFRRSTQPFQIRTTGDRNRATPFAGIYEIDVRETEPSDVEGEFF